jgi:hypothetical protein
MAGNQKQRRKKKTKASQKPATQTTQKRRLGASEIIFIGFGILIILSMVIGLMKNFSF